jgi:hypothetical protein
MVTQNYTDSVTTSVHSDVATGSAQHNGKGTTSQNESSMSETMLLSLIDAMAKLELGTYQREHVSNVTSTTTTASNLGRQLFDTGLRLMMSYHHELAALYFHACIRVRPNAALAHGLMSRTQLQFQR